MRRLATCLLTLLATGLLAGCGGVDAQRAQALLQQAQQAQQSVSSETFLMKLNVEAEGQSATIAMQGGGYLKGPSAGDFYVAASGALPGGAGSLDLTVVKRDQTVTMRMNGQTQTLPLPAAESQLGSSLADPLQFADIARFVKDVSVSETDLAGRPADKLVGTLDTQGLVSGLGGISGKLFGDLGVHLGDVRVVLFIPRDSHLVETMLADMTISAQGKSAHFGMSFSVAGIDRPVAFPQL